MAYYKASAAGGIWTDLTPTLGAELIRSAQDIIKFIHSGGVTTIYGADASADQLIIKANQTDALPNLTVYGTGHIFANLPGAREFKVYTNGVALLRLRDHTVTMKEGSTPTAVTDYGSIYTKSDNKLYFQDGAGTEHEVAFV